MTTQGGGSPETIGNNQGAHCLTNTASTEGEGLGVGGGPVGQPGASGDGSPVKAVLWIVFGISLFSVQDVIIRGFSGELPLMQVLFMRGILVVAFTLLFLKFRGELHLLRITRKGLVAFRAFMVFFSFTLYYLALASIPMAAAVSIYYVAPLILTGLAAVFGKETVGARRWTAVIIGLLGVIVIMRPGAEAIDPAAALALIGAASYAVFNLLTRQLASTENSWGLSFSHNVGYVAFSGIVGLAIGDGAWANDGHPALSFMTMGWVMPTAMDGLLIFVIAMIATVGFYGLTEGYRTAPSSVVAPFEYVIIPWSVFWGLVIWSETPHWMTWVGTAMILGSGLYVIYRERVRGQRVVTRRFTRWRP